LKLEKANGKCDVDAYKVIPLPVFVVVVGDDVVVDVLFADVGEDVVVVGAIVLLVGAEDDVVVDVLFVDVREDVEVVEDGVVVVAGGVVIV